MIGIVMATRLEAQPFLKGLKADEPKEHPVPTYRSDRTVLVISGIGKVNAAIATTYCHLAFRPDLILNLGAAGSTGPSHGRGDMLHITKVVEYDRPHLGSNASRVHIPEVLSGFPTATLATQDHAVVDERSRKKVAAVADLVDMEGASVVHAARTFGIPCYLFKFVSDTPDHTGESDIIDYIRSCRTPFFEYITNSALPLLMQRYSG